MAKKLIAHGIHHTHWDPYWWFSHQESVAVFAYNMHEMLKAFDTGKIKDFFFDGQTDAIDEYLSIYPEDREKVRKYVTNGQLVIGPFISQLDTYISSGESVVNNLRIGIKHAKALGKANRIAYLADPFGASSDMPKIYNQCGIYEFVFTRGMGEEYGTRSEFYFKSNDGSQVLSHVMLAGYGYGAHAFREGTLFTNHAADYNKINVDKLIDRLVSRSTLDGEFFFPLGFDNFPVMLDIPEKIKHYNSIQDRIEFKYTTWEKFFEHVRKNGKDIKTYQGEILSPQYHRLHMNGMHSARSDIKTLIDRTDRRLVFELQPMMAMLDAVGIPYNQGMIDHIWFNLVNTQTHGSATHGDETNEWIKDMATVAANFTRGTRDFLLRLLAVSVKQDDIPGMALVVLNTLPWKRQMIQKLSIVTHGPAFKLELDGKDIPYTVLDQVKHYFGTLRKEAKDMQEDIWFHRTEIICNLGKFEGLSYKTLSVIEQGERKPVALALSNKTSIENEYVSVSCGPDGITISDKQSGQSITKALFFEDGGDEGDSYDYDYPAPEDEWLVYREITQNDFKSSIQSGLHAEMHFEGDMAVPSSTETRKQKVADMKLPFSLTLSIEANSGIVRVVGNVKNDAENHRLRIGVRTGKKNAVSHAGSQYGIIQRPVVRPEMAYWRERGYFEEPSSTNCLLNHVSAFDEKGALTIFTRSLKEYELTGEGYGDVMLTVLRAMGFVGRPDLHRRPGRPSGMPERYLPAPTHQMKMTVEFDFGIGFSRELNGNKLFRQYAHFGIEETYVQNQKMDPTFFLISYFPINEWETTLPAKFNLATLEGSDASFGTLIKSDGSEEYIMRLFNADNASTKAGQLTLGDGLVVVGKTDLVEEKREKRDGLAEQLAAGELLNLVIKKKVKDG